MEEVEAAAVATAVVADFEDHQWPIVEARAEPVGTNAVAVVAVAGWRRPLFPPPGRRPHPWPLMTITYI